METYRITGADAVRIAERENLTVQCHANPIDDGGPVEIGVARQIMKEDPSLVFVDVIPTGWRNLAGNYCDPGLGYHAGDYFNRTSGEYLGPDCEGVEPCWSAAPSLPVQSHGEKPARYVDHITEPDGFVGKLSHAVRVF